MESKTYIKNVRISPKKLRFSLADIKRLGPQQALEHLLYSPQKSAKIFYKAIQSAVTAAKQTLKVDSHLLKFKLLTIEEGQKLKRFRAGGRGTASPYVHRLSHIKIVLVADNPQISKEKGSTKVKSKTESKVEAVSKEVKMSSTEAEIKVKKTKEVKEKKPKVKSAVKKSQINK